ncbi:class I SAM-dependent methyltransferase [Paenibacillus allorhizosphaerae]|uniref:Methyltransferase YcgJ n=1 Tax=Paenibacillus allorhizosphaerae TaxID=2849866 RepID=A0ABN7TSR3_9BACL|nr:class I SAM-dependent methyltransferase [Paenibacillus allorhizosphaerae]CAG7654427.1 putative methyltransferase YcgJ [Paenibacillus allorhizosphaerae]
MDIKNKVLEQFGKNAQEYVESPIHSSRDDLEILEAWVKAEKPAAALDIATGGGHAANTAAPWVGQMTALDLTPEILKAAETYIAGKGHSNVSFVLGDAESLPFASETFELAMCRIAAHHFPDVDAFLNEALRVIKPGGCLLLLDNVAPEAAALDELYNDIEKRRDPSHARAWKKSEWIRKVETAGLETEQLLQFQKTFQFESWCQRMKFAGEPKEALESLMLGQPSDVRRALGVQTEDGKLVRFQGKYMMLRARKPQ